MPFTLSHTAIVLPFSRFLARWWLLSAVLIGAMVPDFGFFFPWHLQRLETHSAAALITFCLPVGLVTYWLFQYLIKTPILELLPQGAYARWYPFGSPAAIGSIRRWLFAALGVLAGAVTHLVWDGFTHDGARGVRMFPVLDDPIVDFGSHRLLGVRLMQDGSSLLGLAIMFGLIGYALRRGAEVPVRQRPLPASERRAWQLTYVIAAVGLSAVWFLWARMGEATGHSLTATANNIAVATLRGLAIALLSVSVALNLRLRALKARVGQVT